MSKLLMIFLMSTTIVMLHSQCEKICKKSTRCDLIPESGPYYGYFPRYYYDRTEGICKQFIWGGCDGVVPFETLEDCEKNCYCD